MAASWGIFPFGAANTERPSRRAAGAARAAVVGVYPSAFHVSWTAPAYTAGIGRRGMVTALAVDVEPTVFWDGDRADFQTRLQAWKAKVNFTPGDLTGQHGHVSDVSPTANGSSGATVTRRYLDPLSLTPAAVGFTDVYPVFVVKSAAAAATSSTRRGQADAIRQEYDSVAPLLGRPESSLPPRPSARQLPQLAAAQFGQRVLTDLEHLDPPLVITLGEEVWRTLVRVTALSARPPANHFSELYGDRYGSRGSLSVNGQTIEWLPLVHPGLLRGGPAPDTAIDRAQRTVAGWNALHARWTDATKGPSDHDVLLSTAHNPTDRADRGMCGRSSGT